MAGLKGASKYGGKYILEDERSLQPGVQFWGRNKIKAAHSRERMIWERFNKTSLLITHPCRRGAFGRIIHTALPGQLIFKPAYDEF